MAFIFDQALKRACDAAPDTALLYAQWEYDRRLVAESLQSIVRYFPHYSRHEASHSDAILRQIARILGPERVERLSATDLWLVLETAYHHDIGMIVRDDEVRAWLRDDSEFQPYLRDTAQGDDRELAADARRILEAMRAQSPVANPPFDVYWAVLKLVAEFARRRHPQRSQDVVRQPGRIGLASPRTHLVPARLYDLIGRIAASHGKSLANTLRLPYRESGMGMDHAHPRFVACLLRLGDLLDLDNGRFCPTLLATLGGLPATSKAHVGKHAAITHLDVAPDRINVQAQCDDYAAYEVTDQWLGWLRDELTGQMVGWADIAPPGLGSLPSIGQIGTELVDHVALDAGKRPRFEVDRDAFMHLVRGSNLYSHRFAFVRELIQNAIDATLVRFWKDRWCRLSKEKLETKTPEHLREELKHYPVNIHFKRVKDRDTATQVAWAISIADRGSGISLDDVRHLRTIGGSRGNRARRRLVEDMPEWMRPSGIFGVGLQSVFSATSKLTIKTRHMDGQETFVLTLRNGEEHDSDGLTIRKSKDSKRLRRPGTRVQLVAMVDRVPLTVSHRPDEVVYSKLFSAYDPIIHDELPLEIVKAYEEILELAKNSLCRLRPVAREFDAYKTPPSATTESAFEGEYYKIFDRKTCMEVGLKAQLTDWGDSQVSYRGCPVTRSSPRIALLDLSCDVLAGEASQFLTLNREKWSESGDEDLHIKLCDVIQRKFPEYLASLRQRESSKEELSVASLRAFLYGNDEYSADIVGEEWKDLQVSCFSDGSKRTDILLGELLSAQSIRLKPTLSLSEDNERFHGIHICKDENDLSYSIELVGRRGAQWLPDLLRKWSSYIVLRMAIGANHDEAAPSPDRVFYKNENEQEELFDEASWMWLCAKATDDSTRLFHGGRRRKSIPCPKQYRTLLYRDDCVPPWVDHIQRIIQPRMVFPFVVDDRGNVTLNGLFRLVQKTALQAKDDPRTEEDVARAYLEFIKEVDVRMSQSWASRKAYSLDEAHRELRPWLSKQR